MFILDFTNVFVTFGKGSNEVSVLFAIPVFTNIFVSIGKNFGALSVLFAIPVFTNVFVPKTKTSSESCQTS